MTRRGGESACGMARARMVRGPRTARRGRRARSAESMERPGMTRRWRWMRMRMRMRMVRVRGRRDGGDWGAQHDSTHRSTASTRQRRGRQRRSTSPTRAQGPDRPPRHLITPRGDRGGAHDPFCSVRPGVLALHSCRARATPPANRPSHSHRRYPGFQTLQLLPTQSTPTRSASAVFASLPQAAVALKALDGFLLKPGTPMGVVIVPQNAL